MAKLRNLLDDYEWTGQYEYIDLDEWWCPSCEEWSACSGPCPNGTEHGPHRVRSVKSKQMRVRS